MAKRFLAILALGAILAVTSPANLFAAPGHGNGNGGVGNCRGNGNFKHRCEPSPAPEIDVGGGLTAIALLVGSLLMLHETRRHIQ